MPRTKSVRRRGKFAHQWLRTHFAPFPVDQLVTKSCEYPENFKVELVEPLAALTREVGPAGFTGLYFDADSCHTLSALLIESDGPVRCTLAHFEQIDLGMERTFTCLRNGLWLGGEGKSRFAAMFSYDTLPSGACSLNFEVATIPGTSGERQTTRQLKRLQDAVSAAKVLRGRVLTMQSTGSFRGPELKVQSVPAVERGQIVLPPATLDLIDRNIVQFVSCRGQLKELGLPTKKGVLFYGQPGTGKSHTLKYLATILKDMTTVVVPSDSLHNLSEYIALARLLQPSILVIEDVDLIAEDRGFAYDPGTQGFLNKLLNEMDGLREDDELLFIMTTNRPEALEKALAARPGRIDQAIEFPLPDEACRRRLISLYAGKMPVTAETVAALARRSKDVSASFIRELMRRTAQAWLLAGGTGEVGYALFERAIEEMTMLGGKYNAKLHGVNLEPMGFVRNAS